MNIKKRILKNKFAGLFFAGFAFAIASCGSNADELQQQVFAIHDEAMPKKEDIYNLRKDLLEVKATGTANKQMLSSDEIAEVTRVCDSLTVAEIAMEDWMHGYKKEIETASSSEKAAYFAAELPKIQKVRSTMFRMIDLGKATCLKYPKIQEDKPAETAAKTDAAKFDAAKTAIAKPNAAKADAAKATESTKTTTTENGKTTIKTETKVDGKIVSKTEKTANAPKSTSETSKTVEKTVETVDKGEKAPAQPLPPAPPGQTTVKAVQPRVSTGAARVPR